MCQTQFCHSAQQTQPSGEKENYTQLYEEMMKEKNIDLHMAGISFYLVLSDIDLKDIEGFKHD